MMTDETRIQAAPNTPRVTVGRKAAFSLAATVLALALAELLMRALGIGFQPAFLSQRVKMGYGYPPGYDGPGAGVAGHGQVEHLTVNSHGFRGPEISKQKPAGVFRIICLGDSVTMGTMIQDEANTYPRQLERLLRAKHRARSFEVINAGVHGTTSLVGKGYLSDVLLDFHPDLVIICFGWNDHSFTDRTEEDILEVLTTSTKDGADRFLALHSRIYQCMTKAWLAYKLERTLAQARTRVHRVPIERYRDNLEEMVNAARRAGARVMLMTSPARRPAPGGVQLVVYGEPEVMLSWHEKYADVVRDIAAKTGLPLVDNAARFRRWSSDLDRLVFPDGIHPTEEGQRLIAEAMVEQIDASGLLSHSSASAFP